MWAGARRGEDAGRGSGPGWAPGRGRAHTQGVLDVDQPAVETEDLGNQDQLVRHRLVRALVSGQEGFALPPALLPLGDERACGTGDRRGQAFPPTPRPAVRSPGPAAAASLRPANPSGLQTLGWESDTLGPSRGRQQAGEGPGCRRTLKKHGCAQGWATTACFYKQFYWNAAAHFLACHPWRLLPHEWSQQ